MTRARTWSRGPSLEWAHRLGASPLKRMAASWSGPDAGPTEYKVAARYYAQNGRLPSVRTAATATEIRSRQNRPAATNQLDIDIPIQEWAHRLGASPLKRMAASWSGPDAGPTEYKVAARYYAQNGRLPSVRTAATATEIRSRQNRPAATNQLDIDIPIQVRADQGAALGLCRLAGCCTGFAERFERLAQGELTCV